MIKPFGGVAPQIDESAFIAETAVVIGDVHIGAESSVWYGAVVRGDCFYVRIGRRANIQDNSVIHVSNGAHATILEDDVTVGHSATLHGCYVERGALIGIGAIVLDGARIGAYSLVAAGALVTPGTQIPPRSLVMGAPAKVKRQLTDAECADLDTFWQNYVGYVKQYKAEGFGDKN
jgi:carbonic anhydrase/acetyltransferase-like protein (isoleucine patch superfamily)